MKKFFTTALMTSMAFASQSFANTSSFATTWSLDSMVSSNDKRTGRWEVFAPIEAMLSQDVVVEPIAKAVEYTNVAALPVIQSPEAADLAPERVQFASYTRLPQLSEAIKVSSVSNFSHKTVRPPSSNLIEIVNDYSELSLTPAVKPKKRNLTTLKKIKLAGPKYAGIPSKKSLSRMPRASGGAEWACLTEALYFEARGESVSGIFAVAEVIVNRKKSRKFPNTVCSVISQGSHRKNACQFSYKCDGINEVYREPKARELVAKIAQIVLERRAPLITSGATFYHANTVNPRWSRSFRRTATIGKHYFYRG